MNDVAKHSLMGVESHFHSSLPSCSLFGAVETGLPWCESCICMQCLETLGRYDGLFNTHLKHYYDYMHAHYQLSSFAAAVILIILPS